MADVELVIKIDEKDFEIIKHNIAVNNPLCPLSQEEMVSKVANGIPLPKHHGDLIDRDALIYKRTHHCGYQTPFKLIDEDNLKNAPAIIEADRKVKE